MIPFNMIMKGEYNMFEVGKQLKDKLEKDVGVYVGRYSDKEPIFYSYDTKEEKFENAITLGRVGKGKNFMLGSHYSAKNVIVDVLINTNNEIVIVDTDGEYKQFTECIGGEYISLSTEEEIENESRITTISVFDRDKLKQENMLNAAMDYAKMRSEECSKKGVMLWLLID